MNVFKIVRRGKTGFKFLYHGINKSRHIPLNKWLEADVKQVRDGSGKGYYESGFHVLPDLPSCLNYLKRFKSKDLCIVECAAENTRPKSKSKNVLLARKLMVIGETEERL